MGDTNITGTAVSSAPEQNDWEIARDAIIAAALRKIGAIESGATPSTTQYTEGAEQLNAMVKDWVNDGIQLWNQEWKTQNLDSGVASYAMPTIGLSIDKAFLRDPSGNDTDVEIISQEKYYEIVDKDATGEPGAVCPKQGDHQITLYTYPVINASGYVLHYLMTRRLEDFDASGDTPDVPVRWELALIFGLADLLAPEYGLPLKEREEITKKALFYKERARTGNPQTYDDNFVESAY